MLETVGLDAEVARAAAGWAAAGDASVGRVTRVDRGVVTVLTEAGLRRCSIGGGLLNRMAQPAGEGVCTGDWCLLREWPDHRTTLERVLPRRTALIGPGAGEHGRVLCANVDIVALVLGTQPRPVPASIERLLAVVRQSGIRPLVVLTGSQLVAEHLAEQPAEDLAAATRDVDVLPVSAGTGAGVAELRARLEGRLTIALLGASGHGSSAVADALVGAEVLSTRTPRPDGRAGHPSVRRELVPLPGGGAVVDMPGVRSVGPGRPRFPALDGARPRE